MSDAVGRLIGRSAAVQSLNEEIERAACSDAKVLVTGESGAGKEIVAGLIHARSRRERQPFVTINCAGLPDTLLESELFGHVRGSFTDAFRDRPGLLERGHGGTVFLDEVGEMSPRMQGLLLRFLETGEIARVGEDRTGRRVDVRIVAATNRVLLDRVAENAFRSDLYYRLNVVHLVVPPLRDRREDVAELLDWFFAMFAQHYRVGPPVIAPEALDLLVEYHWPGNVRELRNVVERLLIRGHRTILPEHLPRDVAQPVERQEARQPDPRPRAVHLDRLVERMVNGQESFWSVVYDAFMAHDLTREDVRAIVSRGAALTHGNYAAMVQLFNMEQRDHNAFLSFLKRHRCHTPIVPTATRAARAPASKAPSSRSA
jgi:two-component system, NtrC family, response regulator AtoC